MADPAGPEPAPRQVDPGRVLQKLQLLDANLVQLAVLQVLAEDQDEEIRQLRAELVRATSAQPDDPAGEEPAGRR